MKNGSSGFGLVEILITAVILGILAIAMSKMLVQSFKGQNTISANSALDDHFAYMALLLKTDDSCKSSLGAPGAAGIAYTMADGAPNIKIFEPKPQTVAGVISYAPGSQLIAGHGVEVPRGSGQFDAVSLMPAKTASVVGATTEYVTTLHMDFNRSQSTTVGSQVKSKDLPMVVVVDNGTGKIVSCHSVGAGNSQLANQVCPDNQVMVGFDAAGMPACMVNDSGYQGAGLLGPHDPLPPGAQAISCSFGNVAGTFYRPFSCGGDGGWTCSYHGGQWYGVRSDGVERACSMGVTVDFPPEGTVSIAGKEFYAVPSPATTTSTCITGPDTEKACKSVVTSSIATAPIQKKIDITIPPKKAGGLATTKNTTVLWFNDGTADGFVAASGGVTCAYVAGSWKLYNGISPSPSSCQSMTFLAK